MIINLWGGARETDHAHTEQNLTRDETYSKLRIISLVTKQNENRRFDVCYILG